MESANSDQQGNGGGAAARGYGAMRSHIEEQSEADEQQHEPPRYTHSVAPNTLMPAEVPPPTPSGGNGGAAPVAVVPADCPVCAEQIQHVYEESRQRSSGQQAKARSAAQQMLVERYRMVFGVENFLRAYWTDNQLLPLLLALHQHVIEKPAREQGFDFVPWTLALLKRHFNPRDPHMLDPIREMRNCQALFRTAIFSSYDHLFEQDPANPANTVVNSKAASAMTAFTEKNMKLLATIRKMQTENDENIANAMFTLVSTLKRVAGLEGVDEEMLRNPHLAAGTVVAGGSSIRTATNSNSLAGVAQGMYTLSGF